MSYRLVIFDFDGVLADSAPWFVGVLNDMAARHGFRAVDEAEIEALRRCDNREIMRRLGVSAWRLPFIAADMRARVAREAASIPLFDGAQRTLAALSEAGIACSIVSSNSEANIRSILGPGPASKVAHFACGAGMFGKASKFRAVMRRAGVPPAETLCVGDEHRDIEAARAAGARCAAALWGYADPEFLKTCGADLNLESLDEIPARVLAS